MKPVKPIAWRNRQNEISNAVAMERLAQLLLLPSAATPPRTEHVRFVRVSKCCPVRRRIVAAPVARSAAVALPCDPGVSA